MVDLLLNYYSNKDYQVNVDKLKEFYEFNDPCFIFEDDCWHGVGQVSSRRTQVRINGIVNQDILSSYLAQPDRALLPALMMLSSV